MLKFYDIVVQYFFFLVDKEKVFGYISWDVTAPFLINLDRQIRLQGWITRMVEMKSIFFKKK